MKLGDIFLDENEREITSNIQDNYDNSEYDSHGILLKIGDDDLELNKIRNLLCLSIEW